MSSFLFFSRDVKIKFREDLNCWLERFVVQALFFCWMGLAVAGTVEEIMYDIVLPRQSCFWITTVKRVQSMTVALGGWLHTTLFTVMT